jgi:hypothetical protein
MLVWREPGYMGILCAIWIFLKPWNYSKKIKFIGNLKKRNNVKSYLELARTGVLLTEIMMESTETNLGQDRSSLFEEWKNSHKQKCKVNLDKRVVLGIMTTAN